MVIWEVKFLKGAWLESRRRWGSNPILYKHTPISIRMSHQRSCSSFLVNIFFSKIKLKRIGPMLFSVKEFRFEKAQKPINKNRTTNRSNPVLTKNMRRITITTITLDSLSKSNEPTWPKKKSVTSRPTNTHRTN